jgi:chromosome segregation ATPase
MANKENVLRQMAAKLEKLDARLKELGSGLEGSREQVRARYNEEYAKLKAQRESIERQMNTLKEAGVEALKQLRSGLGKGFRELKKSLGQARKRFSKEKDVEPPASKEQQASD